MEIDIRPAILVRHPDIVGENPLWHPEEHRLYWTDNRSQRVYRLDPATGKVETVVEGYSVYAFTFQADGSLLLFMDRTRVGVLRNGQVEVVLDGIPGDETARFNDVLADPVGRVLGGTVPTAVGTGALYCISTDGSVRTLVEGMGLPNGMAFTPALPESQGERMGLYVADTRTRRITLYDYEVATGSISNARAYLDFSEADGAPDGMTVDADGYVWVALAGAWAVARFDCSGKEVQRIGLPARKVTSLSFGGEALDTLFITSSSRQSVPGEETGPEGGALFAVKPGVRGWLDYRSRIRPIDIH